jgi:ferredoxin
VRFTDFFRLFNEGLKLPTTHERGNETAKGALLKVIYCDVSTPLLGNDTVYTFQRTHDNSSCVLCGPCYNSLLGNTKILEYRRVVFYLVRAMPKAGQRANRHTIWKQKRCSMWGPCRGIIRESNSEAGSCRSTEEHKKSVVEWEWEFSQLSVGNNHGKLIVEEEFAKFQDKNKYIRQCTNTGLLTTPQLRSSHIRLATRTFCTPGLIVKLITIICYKELGREDMYCTTYPPFPRSAHISLSYGSVF